MSAAAYTGPGTDLKPDEETIHAFVDWWFEPCGQGQVELGWMDAGGAGLIHHRRFGLSAVGELAAVAARMNLVPGQSVYVRPATVATPAGEVTTDRHFCQAPGPWSDLDTPEQVALANPSYG